MSKLQGPIQERPCVYCKISTRGMPDGRGLQCWVCFREPCIDKFDEVIDLKIRLEVNYTRLMGREVTVCIEPSL